MNPQKRRAIFERFRAANPHPKSELEHMTPFELLVAVVLSAQATDKGVNKATAKLFPVARTPQAIVKLGVEGLIPYVQSIGLFRNKAKNIVALCGNPAARARRQGARSDREALEALPGVGRKTANVVLNVAFGQPTIAVDTHIFRVANRTGIAPGKTPAVGRAEAPEIRAGRIQAARASLAHPARSLRLHRAQAEMPRVPDPRSLRVPPQDEIARCSRRPATTRDASSSRRGRNTALGSRFRQLEKMAAELIALHPEYHPIVENPERHADRDWRPESGETNPFLHLSLHLAVAEQLAIDQPPGIRAQFERLRAARGDEHAALHAILECLGEVIWSAQRQRAPLDAALYLACLERQR